MGGSSYDRDVGRASSPTGNFADRGTSSAKSKQVLSRKSMENSLSPYNRSIKSTKISPVCFNLDVSGSNIEFATIFYDKAPMLHGQIEQQGYLKDFDISFSATGDAYTDSAPLQVGNFAYGLKNDAVLAKLFLEGGGGGQKMETYELSAYYFAKKCTMPNAKNPFFFFIGDEAPYPELEPRLLQKVVGSKISKSVDSGIVFESLMKKFKGNVFFLQNPYYGNRNRTYETNSIRAQWEEYFGDRKGQILPVYEEKSVVDVILGVIALRTGSRGLEGYLEDMKNREQTATRIANVRKTLEGLPLLVSSEDDIDESEKSDKTEDSDDGLWPDSVKRNSGGKKL
jgi:hypothetical protein